MSKQAEDIRKKMKNGKASIGTWMQLANADVAEFIAKEGSKVTKKPVKELGMPIGVTIGGLVRGEEGMLVSGNTQIEPGDSVMVFCHNINMKKIEKYFI